MTNGIGGSRFSGHGGGTFLGIRIAPSLDLPWEVFLKPLFFLGATIKVYTVNLFWNHYKSLCLDFVRISNCTPPPLECFFPGATIKVYTGPHPGSASWLIRGGYLCWKNGGPLLKKGGSIVEKGPLDPPPPLDPPMNGYVRIVKKTYFQYFTCYRALAKTICGGRDRDDNKTILSTKTSFFGNVIIHIHNWVG